MVELSTEGAAISSVHFLDNGWQGPCFLWGLRIHYVSHTKLPMMEALSQQKVHDSSWGYIKMPLIYLSSSVGSASPSLSATCCELI